MQDSATAYHGFRMALPMDVGDVHGPSVEPEEVGESANLVNAGNVIHIGY